MDVGNSERGVRAAINVTPLVDIVLVLLIIFMVLTPSTLKHLSAKVPKQAEETTLQVPADSSIVVDYAANRQLTINREPVAIAAFPAQLRRKLQSRREQVVFFRADDAAPYGEVVRLMDAARGAGAQTLALVTRASTETLGSGPQR
jgi:biopolymer transport protein ExbD